MLIAALGGTAAAFSAAWYLNVVTEGRIAARLPAASILSSRPPSNRLERYEDRVRRRKTLAAALPTPFRDSAVVEQLLDVQLASRAYWNFVDGKFSSPELLANDAVWSRYKMPTFLPPQFARKQRAGYEFEFRGAGCEEAEAGWPDCVAYTYLARPLKADPASPTFALLSGDDTIHYTTDGRLPTRDDPSIAARPAR
jgi:hypothetical protein